MKGAKKHNDNDSSNQILSAADKYKEMGNQAFKHLNYEKALEYYSKAIEIDNNAIYYSNRSATYFELEDYENSIKDAIKCVELNPNFIKGFYRQALAYREIDEIDKAIEILKKSQEIEKYEPAEKLLQELIMERKEFYTLPIDDPEYEKVQKFIKWLDEGKAKFSKLKIKHFSKNHRGILASRKIKAKEEILFIPKTHVITLEMAKQTSVGKSIIKAELDLLSPKHSFLSTFLLQEKYNPNSFWKPYLDLLPFDFNSVPIFFSEEELSWLEGSPFLDQVRDKKNDIKRDYDMICKVAPEFSKYTFNDFCWARLAASSRIFGVVIDQTKTDIFVPLADMLNHRRPKQASWFYSNEKEGFIIESLEEIPRGDQVYDSYGKKCNSRFFLNYGFIALDNDGNEVVLEVDYKPKDPCWDLKRELIGDNLVSKTFRVMANVDEDVVIEFMNFIRFTEINDKNTLLELMNIYENSVKKNGKEGDQGYKPQKTPPITIELETRVLERVNELCTKQLNRYKTTLNEDKELLASGKLTLNQRNCVMLRSGEKEILHYLATFSQKCLPLLNLSSKQIRKASLQSSHNQYSNHITKVILFLVQKKEKATEQQALLTYYAIAVTRENENLG